MNFITLPIIYHVIKNAKHSKMKLLNLYKNSAIVRESMNGIASLFVNWKRPSFWISEYMRLKILV